MGDDLRKRLYLALLVLGMLGLLMGCGPKQEEVAMVEAAEMAQDYAERLCELGITEADAEFAERMQDYLESFPPEVAEAWEPYQVVGLMLADIGMGEYDFDNGSWTPSSQTVYAFDVEVFDLDRMYTLFLQGVQSIVGDELIFENIQEDTSQVNHEEGNGVQVISFTCQGRPYRYEAEVYNDWFDMGAVAFVNEVLAAEGLDKRLWCTSDGYQECILFYNTPQWAESYAQKMGYALK